ncbi:unnamed protein product [Paramecium sonneborni]|uniref:Response regulatory domain-containing protein n=1 Tax=Paramecium sonneborni TaxID=65129 RepID=A0A8S1R9G9_9CILI|nr:unnamed protein product [Paramecium sonneborni]
MEKEEEISIIIMDLDMPIIEGIEATKILVELMFDQKLDYIPLIGCSAHDDKDTMDKYIQGGMLYEIVKPVFGKILTETFQQIINSDDMSTFLITNLIQILLLFTLLTCVRKSKIM